MYKLVVSLVFILITAACYSQNEVDTIKHDLQQLRWSKRITPKYINFDVAKLMLGHGRSAGHPFDHGVGLSLRTQFLWPYAFFKNDFPITVGITAGYSKITARNARFSFDENKLISITEDKDIKNTMHRTGYTGIVLLHVIRNRNFRGFTALTGASLEHNIYSRLKQRTEDDNSAFSSKRYINRMSLPLHLQVSYSRRQFLSGGIYCSYDTKSRFKGSGFKGIRQITAGASVALII